MRLLDAVIVPAALVALLGACFCCSAPSPGARTSRVARGDVVPAVEPPAGTTPDGPTHALMRNVDFHAGAGVVLHVRSLSGALESRVPHTPIAFDDPEAFTIRIDTADVALRAADLAHLLNDHVFAYRGAPIRDLRFRIADGHLVQSGIMHKGVDLPFTITATVALTPEGLVRMHPVDVKLLGVDGDRLMRALHLKLEDLLDLSGAKGVRVEGNDLLLDAIAVVPPPRIAGRLVDVRIEGAELVQRFGREAGPARAPAPLPDSTRANYMFFRGGTLHFGRLFMVDASLQIADADPADAFDFSIADYQRQLVAGWSRNTATGALVVLMPDYRRVVADPALRLTGAR